MSHSLDELSTCKERKGSICPSHESATNQSVEVSQAFILQDWQIGWLEISPHS